MNDSFFESIKDKNIKELFRRAKLFIEEHGKLSTLFITDFEHGQLYDSEILSLFVKESDFELIDMEKAFLNIMSNIKKEALNKEYNELKFTLKKGGLSNDKKKQIINRLEILRKELKHNKLFSIGREQNV